MDLLVWLLKIKGFDKIIKKINSEFDNALIRMHIIIANYNDKKGKLHSEVIENLKKIKLKKNIQLEISTNLLSDQSLLIFLNKNDINILNYQSDDIDDGSLSSAVDHAISSRRPFSISSSFQFKHIDNFLKMDNNSLLDIMYLWIIL